jgi:2-oxo-4-hydroxy-4-carboxy-5-ureidoimidazoline decarboxylase
MPVTLQDLNTWPRIRFVGLLGEIFEHSLWVAERAEHGRPFADIGALHAAMVHAVETAPPAEQIELLRAHPELASKEASAGEMTSSSQAEQSSAGLNALSAEELARIDTLNAQYRQKFGFPFIIAVRNHTKASIFSEFERRLANDADTELKAALDHVYAITRMRLDALVTSEK